MYIPTYAQFGETVEFIIEADEQLNPYRQNAYVMFDKNRYDIVLDYNEENNEYTGLFNTGMFPVQSCTVYVELYDDVGNMSEVKSSIQLFSNKELEIAYDIDTTRITYNYITQDVTYKIDKMVVDFDVTLERNRY